MAAYSPSSFFFLFVFVERDVVEVNKHDCSIILVTSLIRKTYYVIDIIGKW